MLKRIRELRRSSVLCVCMMVLIMMTATSCARKGPYIHAQWKQISFADSDIARYVSILNVRARVIDSGNLEVSLKMLNKHDEDLPLRIKFVFMDAEEFTLDETSWIPYTLVRKAIEYVIQNSISYNARTYKVYIDWQYE